MEPKRQPASFKAGMASDEYPLAFENIKFHIT
jgi:hypothetical protein